MELSKVVLESTVLVSVGLIRLVKVDKELVLHGGRDLLVLDVDLDTFVEVVSELLDHIPVSLEVLLVGLGVFLENLMEFLILNIQLLVELVSNPLVLENRVDASLAGHFVWETLVDLLSKVRKNWSQESHKLVKDDRKGVLTRL